MQPLDELNPRGLALTPVTPINWQLGCKALMRLGRSSEDTAAVFDVYRYLNGTSFDAMVNQFSVTAIARRLMEQPSYITDALSNQDALRTRARQSLGYQYLHQLQTEDLNPAAIQSAAISSFDDLSPSNHLRREYPYFHNLILMLNWTHDLVHTLTGYGRDPVGEIAIHQFMFSQKVCNGNGWIAGLGALGLLRSHSPRFVYQIMNHAKRMAKDAQTLSLVDLIPYLDMPLERARVELRIVPDPFYARFVSRD